MLLSSAFLYLVYCVWGNYIDDVDDHDDEREKGGKRRGNGDDDDDGRVSMFQRGQQDAYEHCHQVVHSFRGLTRTV